MVCESHSHRIDHHVVHDNATSDGIIFSPCQIASDVRHRALSDPLLSSSIRSQSTVARTTVEIAVTPVERENDVLLG